MTLHRSVLPLIAFSIASCERATAPPPRPADARPARVERLAAEYQLLRSLPGHMQATHDRWNYAVDAPGGRKAAVMRELIAELGAAPVGRGRIVALLGPPDVIARPGDRAWQTATAWTSYPRAPPRSDELLVYYWRGLHDFYWFAMRGDTAVSSGWWMAGE
jgi:hypothetical protein